jgi:hypothetical protein
MLLLACVLTYCNARSIDPFDGPVVSPLPNGNCTLSGYTHGWPLRFYDRWQLTFSYAGSSDRSPRTGGKSGFSTHALVANVIVGLLMIGSVAILFETWIRRPGKRFQFGILEMLAATVVFALFLSIWQNRSALETAFSQEHLVSRAFRFPSYIWPALLAGTALAVYTIIWMLGRALSSLVTIAATVVGREGLTRQDDSRKDQST